MKLNRNKRGNIEILIIFILVLFLILFIGFIAVIGSATVNFIFDTAMPELTDIGTVETANFTRYAEFTITPLNNIVQQFTWLSGVAYVMVLIASVGIAVSFRFTPNKWLIGFYFGLMLLLVIASMFIANIYEEFHDGTDELATRLQEHTLLSHMILYAPVIFTVIGFFTGIILFSGMLREEFV